MNKVIFGLMMYMVLIGCNQSSSDQIKKLQAHEQSKNGFVSFLDSFSELELPITIDSSFMAETQSKIKDSKPLNETERPLTQIDESIELYEQQLKYVFYKIAKIRISSNWGLLFFTRLNPEIPFDATIAKIWLGIYNTNGVLLSAEEVGLIDLQYGIEKRVFSKLNSEGIELTIVDRQEDLDTGEIKSRASTKTLKINSGKIIQEQ